MKKLIATSIAACALAAGGAASAQDLGSVLANILGLGMPTYQQGTPAVVAGQVYADQYGRRFYYDQYGRQVYLQSSQHIVGYDSWGRPIYGSTNTRQIIGYDSWGRPIYGQSGAYGQGYGQSGTYGQSGAYAYGGSVYGSSWDRDGDGVANRHDRWPDDPRYR